MDEPQKLKQIAQSLAAASHALKQATDQIDEMLESETKRAKQATSVMGSGTFEIFVEGQVRTLLEHAEKLKQQYYTNKIMIIIFDYESGYRLRKQQYSYEQKRQQVQEINAMLREDDLAFADTETGEPCILYAVTSYEGLGRYTLENRITKKRSGSYKWLFELLPFKLVRDVPRREAVIERRKKKGE